MSKFDLASWTKEFFSQRLEDRGQHAKAPREGIRYFANARATRNYFMIPPF
jgi:hypothetical protein